MSDRKGNKSVLNLFFIYPKTLALFLERRGGQESNVV